MARKRSRKNKGAKPAQDTNLINANLWQQHLNAKLAPAKQQALERIVVAGMKVMFSPQTHTMMLTELDAPGNMVDNLAQASTKLMILLFKQSNGSMPGDLLIPAGGVLLAKACEFLNQTGQVVTEEQFRQALVEMSKLILKVAGAPSQPGQATPAPTQSAGNPLNAATPMPPQGA